MTSYSVKIHDDLLTYFTGIFVAQYGIKDTNTTNIIQANYVGSNTDLLDNGSQNTLINHFNAKTQILNTFNLKFTSTNPDFMAQKIIVPSDKGDLILVTPTKITLTYDSNSNYSCNIDYKDSTKTSGSTGNFLVNVDIAYANKNTKQEIAVVKNKYYTISVKDQEADVLFTGKIGIQESYYASTNSTIGNIKLCTYEQYYDVSVLKSDETNTVSVDNNGNIVKFNEWLGINLTSDKIVDDVTKLKIYDQDNLIKPYQIFIRGTCDGTFNDVNNEVKILSPDLDTGCSVYQCSITLEPAEPPSPETLTAINKNIRLEYNRLKKQSLPTVSPSVVSVPRCISAPTPCSNEVSIVETLLMDLLLPVAAWNMGKMAYKKVNANNNCNSKVEESLTNKLLYDVLSPAAMWQVSKYARKEMSKRC
jgi:hypothetical protein